MVARINVLGPVSMTLDGRPVPLGDRKQRTLLSILALENRRVEKARLAQLLWPDERFPQDPDAQLRGYVNRIRKALKEVSPGSERMLRTWPGMGYQLEIDESAVDYHRFRRLAAQAKLALERDAAKSVDLGRAALAEWGRPAGVRGGTPLDAVEPQLERITEALRQEYQAVLMTCLTAELECGRHEQLLPELARLAGYDEYGAENQELARIRMLATYRSGNRTEALEIYERLREALHDSLAAEPDGETRKLRKQIITDDPALQPARADAPLDDEERPAEQPTESPSAPTGPTFHQKAETINNIDRMEAETINIGTFLENRPRP
jgi:DNA-binding SARP family transcriptional activator